MKRFFYLLLHGRFRTLLLEPTDDGFIQFFRFLFVGGAATLVDIGSGWLFFTYVFTGNLPLGPVTLTRDVLSAAVGFLLGLTVNYLLSITWIFRSNRNRVGEFLSFALIGLVGLCIKSGVIALVGLLLPQQTGLLFLCKSVLGTLAALVWNFAARKGLLYRKPASRDKHM